MLRPGKPLGYIVVCVGLAEFGNDPVLLYEVVGAVVVVHHQSDLAVLRTSAWMIRPSTGGSESVSLKTSMPWWRALSASRRKYALKKVRPFSRRSR